MKLPEHPHWAILASLLALAVVSLGLAVFQPAKPYLPPPLPVSKPTITSWTVDATPQFELPGPTVKSLDLALMLAETTPSESVVPLAEVVDTWMNEAARGSRPQACQLAQALLRCREHRLRMRRLGAAEANLATRTAPTDEADINNLASLHSQEEANQAYCRGVPEAHLSRAWEHLMRAAELGDQRALLRLFLNPPLDRDRPLRDYEGWRAHHTRLPGLLEQAVRSGNVEILALQLVEATGMHAPLERQGLAGSAIDGLAAALLLQRLAVESGEAPMEAFAPLTQVAQALTPMEQGQARTRAEQLYPVFRQHAGSLKEKAKEWGVNAEEWACE